MHFLPLNIPNVWQSYYFLCDSTEHKMYITENEIQDISTTLIDNVINNIFPLNFWIKLIYDWNEYLANINSLQPGDVISCYRSLVHVIACCLKASNHYLNKCWRVINVTPRNAISMKIEMIWAIKLNVIIFMHWSIFCHLSANESAKMNRSPLHRIEDFFSYQTRQGIYR